MYTKTKSSGLAIAFALLLGVLTIASNFAGYAGEYTTDLHWILQDTP